jgi:hypothetical protein
MAVIYGSDFMAVTALGGLTALGSVTAWWRYGTERHDGIGRRDGVGWSDGWSDTCEQGGPIFERTIPTGVPSKIG